MRKLFKNLFVPLMTLITFVLLQGCANYTKHVVYDDTDTNAYEVEEVSSWGFFAPTTQIQRTKICDVKKTHVNSADSFGNGYVSKEPVNCRLITAADGYHKDLGTSAGPALMQAGGTVGAGALIGDGIRDSSDTINNSNKQGQFQGQYQNQRSYNRNNNSNCVGFGC